MAVVQISRIQIRRGQANSGSGIPQLASGEMAWAVDTQELYIGNGSVSEGSPAVGNTKVLTANDLNNQGNFLTLLEHTYKFNNTSFPIQTGPDATHYVQRSLQDCLDDRVSLKDFGAVGDGVTDDTAAIQRAINQLFLNASAPSYGAGNDAVSTRITLEIPAGVYLLTGTLYIPSCSTIVGAGRDKSVFKSTVAGPAVQLIHDGYPTAWNGSNLTQPRLVTLKGLTITTTTNNQIALELNSVAECRFENLRIRGAYTGTYNANSQGINLTAFSSLVNSYNNTFKDVRIEGFSYAVYSMHDIYSNTFDGCEIYNVRQGFVLGLNADGSSVGQKYGPGATNIVRCSFDSVYQHAVYINLGTSNVVRNCRLGTSGANNGNVSQTHYPQIYFKVAGNSAIEIDSSRPNLLASINNIAVPYIPEVAGHGTYETHIARRIQLGQVSSSTIAFRLPVSTDGNGAPIGNIVYEIYYSYYSTVSNFTRSGTINVAANIGTGPGYTALYQLSDEYDFAGVDTANKSIQLTFSAEFLDQTGVAYIATPGQIPSSLAIQYTNTLANDSGYFTYTYKAIQ